LVFGYGYQSQSPKSFYFFWKLIISTN
jgi:hypothetical protein